MADRTRPYHRRDRARPHHQARSDARWRRALAATAALTVAFTIGTMLDVPPASEVEVEVVSP